jgi:hypothetical protein
MVTKIRTQVADYALEAMLALLVLGGLAFMTLAFLH